MNDEISHKIKHVVHQYADQYGINPARKLVRTLKRNCGHNKIHIGMYDHAFHFAGGGQRYAAMIAQHLAQNKKYAVTIICNKPVTKEEIKQWYDIDLKNVTIKVIPIPYFAHEKFIYPEIINGINHFGPVSEESSKYDLFINANMHPYIKPLAPHSLFICHFADQTRNRFFEVDAYDQIICNSEFGAKWLKKNWQHECDLVLYPGVAMRAKKKPKEKLIISVARFEEGGSKQQLRMIEAFTKITDPEWKLVLIGGSTEPNRYREKIEEYIQKNKLNAEVKTNIASEKLKNYYQHASIFWHLCGLDENRPHLMEHFGMTTVEAMQNGCVPVVANAGGQKEIVMHKKNGYLINSINELISTTEMLIYNSEHREELSTQCRNENTFSPEKFYQNLDGLIHTIKL